MEADGATTSNVRAPVRATVAVILAGGRGSRMGGPVPKMLLDLGGRPLLAHAIERLRPQVQAIAISTNEPKLYRDFRLPCLEDADAGFPGPLAGLDAAGRHFATAMGHRFDLVCVAGDTPFLPSDLVARLAGATGEGRIAVASSGGRLHPTIALWPCESLADLPLDPRLPNRLRSLATVMEQEGRRVAEFTQPTEGPPIDPFFNINTPEDLATARALVKSAG